jgi:hypothetical protein
MSIIKLLCAGLALFVIAGCNSKEAPKKQDDGGLHINAPGVNVDIGGGKGLQIEAPGTNVNVNPGEGATVTAPGTEASTEKEN